MLQEVKSRGSNIDVNGTTLWVADTGEAELPVILCLHSCFLDGTMFDGLVREAAGKFRVVRPDFRGQGKSRIHDADIITMDMCADDMVALVEKMGLKSINVMAQSMGGDVAFRLISRRQELFRSLVVAGSSACGEPPEQGARFAQWVRRRRARFYRRYSGYDDGGHAGQDHARRPGQAGVGDLLAESHRRFAEDVASGDEGGDASRDVGAVAVVDQDTGVDHQWRGGHAASTGVVGRDEAGVAEFEANAIE